MKLSRSSEPTQTATLNLTSMIDCCFLLLIFFISTLRAPKLEANLPAYLPKTVQAAARGASAQTPPPPKEESNTVLIALRRSGSDGVEVTLNGAPMEGGFARLDTVLAALRNVVEATPTAKTDVVIDAARDVAYRHVVTTLDLCTRHKFVSVSFAVPAKGKEGAAP